MKLITIEKYPSGYTKSITINLVPIIMACVGLYLASSLGFFTGLLTAALIFGYLWMTFKTARVIYDDLPGWDQKTNYGKIMSGLCGVVWPFVIFLLLTDAPGRRDVASIFVNKYFYLRNPFVLKKLKDEDSNKERPKAASYHGSIIPGSEFEDCPY